MAKQAKIPFREKTSHGGADKSGAFATTQWSVVIEAAHDDLARSTAALEKLCRQYWYPVYAFVRRRGAHKPEAEDLTQAFFTHLLDKETLKKVDRRKGKFRTFLLASLTNFLTNEWDKRQTQKRGGQYQIMSLHEAAEEIYGREPVEPRAPEKLFDRRWALLLVETVLTRLKADYAQQHKSALFEKLESGLTGELDAGWYEAKAKELDMTEGAVRVALHRLRRRFGELLRAEVGHTVATPREVDEEIRHLFASIES